MKLGFRKSILTARVVNHDIVVVEGGLGHLQRKMHLLLVKIYSIYLFNQWKNYIAYLILTPQRNSRNPPDNFFLVLRGDWA